MTISCIVLADVDFWMIMFYGETFDLDSYNVLNEMLEPAFCAGFKSVSIQLLGFLAGLALLISGFHQSIGIKHKNISGIKLNCLRRVM